MNFDVLNGRPIRIMWSQRDPSLRKSGVGNIFIKNLDKSIDNKIMYDTFSTFGNILSCKVATDDEGKSKGHGFVHFESDESAQQAISKVNGMLLNGKKVFVGKFVSRKEREKAMGDRVVQFTNIYVKNFGEEIDTDEKLEAMFSEYGTIVSHQMMRDKNGKPRGFGFVSFNSPDEAEKACQSLNGKEMPSGKTLYVGRAQKRAERQAELKRRFEALKQERINKYQGVNLYVKNLDDTIDDERLQKEFSAFGTITSAKVMCDVNGRSKGFGFVCFSTPEEATKAVTEMNNRIVGTKPLYVALAQRKEERKVALMNQHLTQKRNGPMGVVNGADAAMAPQVIYPYPQYPGPAGVLYPIPASYPGAIPAYPRAGMRPPTGNWQQGMRPGGPGGHGPRGQGNWRGPPRGPRPQMSGQPVNYQPRPQMMQQQMRPAPPVQNMARPPQAQPVPVQAAEASQLPVSLFKRQSMVLMNCLIITAIGRRAARPQGADQSDPRDPEADFGRTFVCKDQQELPY